MSTRRRTLLIAGGAAAALVLFVLVPGFIATRPGYVQRFDGMQAKYEPWSQSTHREAGCAGCHVRPSAIARTAWRARMVGVFYTSLLSRDRQPDVFDSPTNEACLTCHNDLRSVSPKGDLRIPHRAHVTILTMRCVECHSFLVHERNTSGNHNPPMAGCLRCHDGDTAEDSCTACHTDKAAPDSHRAKNWSIVHGSRADDPACDGCHKWSANWCVDCHATRPASHVKEWRATHGARVKVHRGCEACHDGPFCVRCHGVVPKVNFDPALKKVQR